MELLSYEVGRSLGVGATSEVFAAKRGKDQTEVALKVFTPLVTHDKDVRRRLALEVEAMSVLKHPNIVSLLGTFDESEKWGLELELVDGGHLKDWMRQYDLPLVEPKIWILAQIAKGLGAAHEMGILHRDLKPENVLVSKNGDVKLSDFGLARSLSRVTITKSGLLIGSLAYMAPEVINLSDASLKSDIFSFGVIAYELLAGKAPFASETPQGLIRQITTGGFAPLRECNAAVPSAIAKVIEACLATNPDQRPPSVWHIEAELMSYLSSSKLLPFCRRLVAEAGGESLAEALKIKRRELVHLVEKESSPLPLRIESLNELKILFPNDEQWPSLIAGLQVKTQKKSKKTVLPLALFGMLVLGGAAGIWIYSSSDKRSSTSSTAAAPPAENRAEEATPTTSVAAPTATPNDGQSASPSVAEQSAVRAQQESRSELPKKVSQVKKAREVVETRPATAKVADTEYGYLEFRVPEDVDIFVGGRYVSPSKRLKYQVEPGKHLVKMVKDGFLPIENTVEVKAEKTSVIRVGGGK